MNSSLSFQKFVITFMKIFQNFHKTSLKFLQNFHNFHKNGTILSTIINVNA